MAITVKRQIWCVSTDDGVAPNTDTVRIAGSQGLLIVGTPLYRGTDGYYHAVATGGTKIHAFLAETIESEKSAGDSIRVVLADRKCIYGIYCQDDGDDSAVVASDVGDSYGINVSTTSGQVGYATLDLNDTANAVLEVVGLLSDKNSLEHSTSDSPGVALVRIAASALASS